MGSENPFDEDWRDCLRAHFAHVVHTQDKVTERTLPGVMLEVGFSEAELKELYLRATMRVDDVDADFVPDLELLGREVEAAINDALQPETSRHQDDQAPTVPAENDAAVSEEDGEGEEDTPPFRPDGPAQLSLF